VELTLLIALMAAATYLTRALPLIVPGANRLAAWTVRWIGPAAPATLAALAAVNVLLGPSQARFALSPLVPAVGAALALMWWRQNLPASIAVGVAVTAAIRWLA
jgi:branched-subunit amino acid transport protein